MAECSCPLPRSPSGMTDPTSDTKNVVQIPNQTVADCDKCSPGWTWNDGRCFLYVNVKMTWAKAERLCLSLNGHLASMRSTNEYNFLRDLIYKASGAHTTSWVGAHDSAEEGTWMWSDGSTFLFHKWGPGQPNNYRGNENCMDINLGGNDHVNDDTCSKALPFVCARSVKASHVF